MNHPQYNAARSDTPNSSYSRFHPNHERSLALLTSLAGLHGDVNTGMQTTDNYCASIESTALPCMGHRGCSHLTTPETVTQSHEPQCQYHSWGSATDASLLKPFGKPSCARLDGTNPFLARSAQPKLTSASYQDQHDAFAIEAAQMQSNPRPTFVPSNSRGYHMSAYHIETPVMERRGLPSRAASMPQSSQVSTPNSTFSKSLQSQNFEDEYQGIVTPNSAVDSKEAVKIRDEAMLTPQFSPRAVTYNTPKREIDSPLVNDWLSSSQDRIDIQSHQFVRDQQQMFSLGGLSLSPYIPPGLLMNHIGGNSIPDQAYTQYDNRMHNQNFTGTFATDTTDNPFMFNMTSNNLNNHVYTGNNSFAPGAGQHDYSTQSHSIVGGFDFNDSPFYGADHYVIGHSPYDVAQPADTLSTQDDSEETTVKQLSKLRDIDRAKLDENLVKWRAQGITYREIQSMGNWDLKESTLRGRYRTLTKPKEKRLRKPQWDNAALSALAAGVDLLAPPTANSRRTTEDLGKVPWKKVTEWMQTEKNCYPYGYHTVKKKYKELLNDRQMQRGVNQWRRVHGEHPL